MIVFWLVAGLLLAGALLMMLRSLWAPAAVQATASDINLALHRDQLQEAERDLASGLVDQAGFAQARAEIQRRVLEDTGSGTAAASQKGARSTALALVLLLPLASVLTYLQVGDPQAAAPAIGSPQAGDRHSVSPEQIQKMVTVLAERLKAEPGNAEGWLMLGRSYTALSRYRDAATAFRRAADLLPGDASVLADLADVTGMAQGKRLAGEPARLVQQALDLDPRHVKALALAGSVAFEAKDYAAARGYWERIVALMPADSATARSVRGSIEEARQMEGGAQMVADRGPAGPTPAPAVDAPAPLADPVVLTGRVRISPALAAGIAPGDTLFVFARAAQGPRMPLAIVRRPADGQPFEFKLDDSMAMSPALRLSAFTEVVVGARISRSGNATPQPGDLVGQSAPLSPRSQGVDVLIDRVMQ